MKDPTQAKTTANILDVIAKFDKVSNKVDRLLQQGQDHLRNDGKLPFQFQKEMLLELNGIRCNILDSRKSLLVMADSGRKAGEDILGLITIASFASRFLSENNMLDEFKIFVERETEVPIRPVSILEKIKFWKR